MERAILPRYDYVESTIVGAEPSAAKGGAAGAVVAVAGFGVAGYLLYKKMTVPALIVAGSTVLIAPKVASEAA